MKLHHILMAVALAVSLPLSTQAATKLEITAQVMFAPQCTIGWLIDQIWSGDRSKDPNNQKNCWWYSKSKLTTAKK